MKPKSIFTAALAVLLGTGVVACAQIPAVAPAPPPAPVVQLRSAAELDQMLGPIALYPDPLIAEILPAATVPAEIVMADRYVNGGGDPNLIDQQPWNPSIKALARYPAILKWMDDNLAWTTALGQAFLYQQPDVMDSIQRLRAQAQALGNLQTTPQQNVVVQAGTIEILPANPQVIYVPVYQPAVVYYQRPYGAPFIYFGIGLPVGIWLNHDFDWHDHHVIVWHHDQPRPPDWWYHRPGERPRGEISRATVWQPHYRSEPVARNIDRGWETRQVHNPAPVVRAQPQPRPAEPPRSRPANGALIGVQSSHETRQYSNRGQESRQMAVSRPAPAPAPRATAPAHSEAPGRPGGRH